MTQNIPSCRVCQRPAERTSWGADVCAMCHSVCASALPNADELDAFYKAFNVDYSGGGRRAGAAERQMRYARRYLSSVLRHCRSGCLIDVGSSTNPFPNLAAKFGFAVTVLDRIRPAELAPAIQFVQGMAEDIQFLRTRFDVVTAFAVVEHFRLLKESIAALVSYAKPGGFIVITTPLVGERLERNSPGHTRWFCPPEHLHLVSPRGIRELFETYGCQLCEQARFELDPIRWALRYGSAAMEGAAGAVLRTVMPATWRSLRDRRNAISQQIALYVFQKEIGTNSAIARG